jgi:hypothetical protein
MDKKETKKKPCVCKESKCSESVAITKADGVKIIHCKATGITFTLLDYPVECVRGDQKK